MNRYERFQKIKTVLIEANGRVVSRERLLEELDGCIHARTLRRDINYLVLFSREPIKRHEKPVFGYSWEPVEGGYEVPGFWLQAEEIWALTACLRILDTLQPGALQSVTASVRKRLEEGLKHSGFPPEQVLSCIDTRVAGSRPTDPRVFRTVAEALMRRRRLEIDYRARYDDNTGRRTVDPHRLVFHRGNWYLLAWDHLRRDARVFALDRISGAATMREEVSTDPTCVTRLSDHGYGIFLGDNPQWAELRFTAERARWVADEVWHSKQQDQRDDDGRLLRRVPYTDPTELVLEILRHGSEVEVLAPPALREHVAATLRLAADRYA
jgi:predicted DNA-binding transcriptional regulator YafY